MKKITTLLLAIYLPVICSHALEYNNSEENPIQSSSPTEALLNFLRAAANENAEAVLERSAGTRKMVLENKPNAMEDFFEDVKGLDFDSTILWVEFQNEDSVTVNVKISRGEGKEKYQTERRLKKINGIWKVII